MSAHRYFSRRSTAWSGGAHCFNLLCLILVLLACAPAAKGQGPRLTPIDCYVCRDTGLVPCEEHGAAREACEEYSFYCSECIDALDCCRGRGWTPCSCVDGDWENLVENPGYELFQGSIDSRQSLVDYMKTEPIYIGTEHFLLMSTLEPLRLTPGEVKDMAAELGVLKADFPWLFRNLQNLSAHAVAHLYAYRLENIYATYCDAYGMTVEEDRRISYRSRLTEVYLAGTAKEQKAWMARNNGAALVSGAGGKFCISPHSGASGGRHKKSYGPNLGSDKNFHDSVIHLTGRCLVERFFYAKMGKGPPGWFKVGFPHWLEWKILEQCSYYLVNIEVKGLAEEWVVSSWDKRAVAMARSTGYSNLTFPLLSKKDFADLGYREHVLSWAYLDFLLTQPRDKFFRYCDNLRSRMPPRDALMDAYGWSELTLENKWRNHLLMTEDEDAKLTRQERFVAEFDRSLVHPDLETRASAAYYLKFCDDVEAAQRIIQAFQEGEVVVRASALEAFKAFENEVAVRWVVEKGLTHSSASVRRNAAIAMGTFPGLAEITVPLLRNLLSDRKAMVRAGAVRALGELHPREVYEDLAARAEDKDPEVRVETALALWNYNRDDALTGLLTLLRDKVWAVRLAAIRALHNVRDKRVIPALIDQLGREGGRLREDIHELLVKMTQQDFNLSLDRWLWWWNNYGGAFQMGGKPSKSKAARERYAIQYHEVDTCSKKFIFLLDISSSMKEKITVEKQAGKTYGKGDLVKTKMAVAQTELVRLLRTFDANILFNIVTFADEVEIWKRQVVAAKRDVRKHAEKYVWNLTPPQKAATNVYDALMNAFDMVDAGFAKRKYESVVDTMFFLSDGNPTAGPVTDVDMILRAVNERNRIHHIKIHTFALGGGKGTGGDTHFLKKLADMTGGEYQVIKVR